MRLFVMKFGYNIRVNDMICNDMFFYHKNLVYSIDLAVR
jgi:hypothetical protein